MESTQQVFIVHSPYTISSVYRTVLYANGNTKYRRVWYYVLTFVDVISQKALLVLSKWNYPNIISRFWPTGERLIIENVFFSAVHSRQIPLVFGVLRVICVNDAMMLKIPYTLTSDAVCMQKHNDVRSKTCAANMYDGKHFVRSCMLHFSSNK